MLKSEKLDQIMYNIVWESHLVHLRNLIKFFTEAEDCIRYSYVLDGADFSKINDEDLKKAKRIANKTVNHLTKERFEKVEEYTGNAQARVNKAEPLIVSAIQDFLDVLPQKIKDVYRKDITELKDDIEKVKILLNTVKNLPMYRIQSAVFTTSITSVDVLSILDKSQNNQY